VELEGAALEEAALPAEVGAGAWVGSGAAEEAGALVGEGALPEPLPVVGVPVEVALTTLWAAAEAPSIRAGPGMG
jgi:hypothetical protein